MNYVADDIKDTMKEWFKAKKKARKSDVEELVKEKIKSIENTPREKEMSAEVFDRLCKTAKVDIFEKPVQNKGMYFDRHVYSYGSF